MVLHFCLAAYFRSPLAVGLAGYAFMLALSVLIAVNHGLGLHNMYRFVRRRVDPIYTARMRP